MIITTSTARLLTNSMELSTTRVAISYVAI
jgi:hypothetical protein